MVPPATPASQASHSCAFFGRIDIEGNRDYFIISE
jgi:hypothetical protein